VVRRTLVILIFLMFLVPLGVVMPTPPASAQCAPGPGPCCDQPFNCPSPVVVDESLPEKRIAVGVIAVAAALLITVVWRRKRTPERPEEVAQP
jgi:hypothetical protein